jgi:5-methylcytosine-specific restriction protein A
MPYRAKRICSVPDCRTVTDSTYCPRHRTISNRRYRERRGRHYDRRRWRDHLRALILARDPLCKIAVKCDGTALSVEVDHIVPLSRGGDDSEANLQGACRACHSFKTIRETGGVMTDGIGGHFLKTVGA